MQYTIFIKVCSDMTNELVDNQSHVENKLL